MKLEYPCRKKSKKKSQYSRLNNLISKDKIEKINFKKET
jgi:hypothetical protein